MKKTYRFLRGKSKKWLDFLVNTVFAFLIGLVLVGGAIYILFSKNELTSGESGWDIAMLCIIVFLLLFSLAFLYVIIRKRIKKDWED